MGLLRLLVLCLPLVVWAADYPPVRPGVPLSAT